MERPKATALPPSPLRDARCRDDSPLQFAVALDQRLDRDVRRECGDGELVESCHAEPSFPTHRAPSVDMRPRRR